MELSFCAHYQYHWYITPLDLRQTAACKAITSRTNPYDRTLQKKLMTTSPFLRDFFGYSGGILLSICSIPQVYLMYTTKSAKDVSIYYAVLFFIGLVLTLVYLILEEAVAGIITMSVEVLLSMVVILLKIYLDHFYVKPVGDEEQNSLSPDTPDMVVLV